MNDTPDSVITLAKNYLYGGLDRDNPVPRNCALGEQMLITAAEQGSAKAQLALYIIVRQATCEFPVLWARHNGTKLSCKPEGAAYYLIKAAEAGEVSAQALLGHDIYYENFPPRFDLASVGLTAEAAYIWALQWIENAALRGNVIAQNLLIFEYGDWDLVEHPKLTRQPGQHPCGCQRSLKLTHLGSK